MELKLNITDPNNGLALIVKAEDASYKGTNGWLVTLEKAWFFMAMQRGQWRILCGRRISADLLDQIGLFLHPLALSHLIDYAGKN